MKKASKKTVSPVKDLQKTLNALKKADTKINGYENQIRELKSRITEQTKKFEFQNKVASLFNNSLLSPEKAYQQVVDLLPSAFSFPEKAGAYLKINKTEYRSANFIATSAALSAKILSGKKEIGLLKVCCSFGKNEKPKKIFLKEEKSLLTAIATRLANYHKMKVNEYEFTLSSDRYKHLVNNLIDVIYEISGEGIIKFVSPAIEHILGYKPAELTGKNFLKFVYGPDREIVMGKFMKLDKKDYLSLEYRFISKSGGIRWVRSATNPVMENGKMTSATGIMTDISAQKVFEQQLRESELLHRSIFTASPDLIIITDLEARILSASEKAMTMFGFNNLEVFKGRHILEYIDPADHEKANGNFAKMFSGNTEGAEEYRAIRADGSTFDVEVTGEFIRDTAGNPQKIILITRDITARKQTEEKLKETEAAFRRMVESINDVIFEITVKGIVTYLSPAVKRILGYEPAELTGRKFFNYIYPGDKPVLINEIKQLGKRDNSYVEYRYLTKDGNVKWVRSSVTPVFENGVLAGGRGTVTDFTDMKEAEDKIRRQNSRLSAIMNAAPDLVFIIDRFGTISEYYASADKLLLVPPEHIIGTNLKNIFDEETSSMMLEKFSECIDRQILVTYEYSVSTPAGLLSYEARIVPLEDDKFLSFVRDITDRKKSEQEIRELNSNLEKRIEERTEELEVINKELLTEIDMRNKVETALKTKSDELETFFSVAGELLCISDMDGRFLKVNRTWEDVLGFSTEELEFKSYLDFIHPDDIDSAGNALVSLSEQKPILNFITRYKTKSGDYRFLEWHSVPVGKLIYGAAHDITERKLSETYINVQKDLATRLSAISDLKEALTLTINSFMNYEGIDAGGIYLINPATGKLDLQASYGFSDLFIEKISGYAPEPDRVKSLMQGNAVYGRFEDVISNKNADVERDGIECIALLPVKDEKRVIGTINLISRTVSQIPARIHAPLESLALQTGAAISRINAENLLRSSRENFRMLFNTIDDFLFILDPAGNIIESNPAVSKRLGYSEEELLKMHVLEVHPPERREEAGNIVNEMLAGKTTYCPIPLITKSGRLIPVETRVFPGKWNSEYALFGISHDTTERQKAEAALRMQSAAFESFALAIIITDTSGKITWANTSFSRLSGYAPDEIIGSTPGKLIKSGKHDNEFYSGMWSTIKSGKIWSGEIINRRKNGSVYPEELTITPVLDREGEVSAFIAIKIDITKRKEAEEELLKARIEAEKANLAKSEFLSRMSHELRTPMNSILGFAQLMEIGELKPNQKRRLSHILKSGKHLLELINEVLDISRIEAGRITLSLEPVQLRSVLNEMVDTISPLAATKGISIEIINPTTMDLFVRSDRQRLKQIVLNLLNNAIKYNHSGGNVTIRVDALTKDIKNNTPTPVRVSIADTGFGIPEADISKIFNPFERIGAEKTETEGTGLGLAVVKKLVDVMGGRVGVESEVGKGSTFWFELPLTISDLERVQRSEELSDKIREIKDVEGKVLYIEDNISNIELIEQILSSTRPGIKLIATAFGKECVPLALDHKPGLILLDLDLPDIHGSEVIELLRGNETTRDIPVVIITADAMQNQVNKMMKAGAKNYLTKPIEMNSFLEVVDEFVK